LALVTVTAPRVEEEAPEEAAAAEAEEAAPAEAGEAGDGEKPAAEDKTEKSD
jgi:hypothetical protein